MTSADLERVIQALVRSEFIFSANDFDERRRAADKAASTELLRQTDFWCKIAIKVAIPVIESSFNVDVPFNRFRFKSSMLDLAFNEHELGVAISRIGRNMDAVAYRYAYSQPVFVGVKFAETVSPAARISIFKTFDQQMLDCRSLTSSMKGGFGSEQMSVTGFILWVFTSHSAAKHFCLEEQETLRKMHFWNKVNSLSWIVDLSSNSVTKHKGLPLILNSVFNVTAFETSLKADRY